MRRKVKQLEHWADRMRVHTHYEGQFLHRCPKCRHEAMIPLSFDMGGLFYPPESEALAYCEKCGTEMEIVD